MGLAVEKWYLDLVTPEGVAVIAYHLRVRLGPLRINGARIDVHGPGGGEHRQRVSIRSRQLPSPDIQGDGLWWRVPSLGMDATYRFVTGSEKMELLGAPPDRLAWWPIAPVADARIELGGRSFQGLGYVERLSMNFSPSRLPISVLRWGRWIGEDGRSLVWIRWEGAKPLTVVLDDGREVSGEVIDDEELRLADESLLLDRQRVLRRGSLRSSLFARRRGSSRILDRSIGSWEETKWLSGAELTGKKTVQGWAIHERVDLDSRGRS